MINIPEFRGVCLAKMVIPIGNRGDAPTQPTSWTWLPANKANEFRIEIPIKLIEEILARKRAQLASAPPTAPTTIQPSSPQRPLQLLLARVVVPVKLHARPLEPRSAPAAPQALTSEHSSDGEEIRKRLLTAAFGVMNVMTARNKLPVQGATKMPTFTIDDDNNITVFNSAQDAAQAGDSTAIRFDSHRALQKISAAWPLSRLVDIWNSIPGQREVQTFRHRGKAVARIWKTIQALGKNSSGSENEGVPEETNKNKAPRKRQVAKRAPTVKKVATDSERSNKKAAVIAMGGGCGRIL